MSRGMKCDGCGVVVNPADRRPDEQNKWLTLKGASVHDLEFHDLACLNQYVSEHGGVSEAAMRITVAEEKVWQTAPAAPQMTWTQEPVAGITDGGPEQP